MERDAVNMSRQLLKYFHLKLDVLVERERKGGYVVLGGVPLSTIPLWLATSCECDLMEA